MILKKMKIRKSISPQKIIHNGEVYKIIKYPQKYFIKNYDITLRNGKIQDVHINGQHPNAQPSTGQFCLPYQLKKISFDANIKQMLEIILSHFNLDDCYFTPWNEIQYRKQEV